MPRKKWCEAINDWQIQPKGGYQTMYVVKKKAFNRGDLVAILEIATSRRARVRVPCPDMELKDIEFDSRPAARCDWER